MPAPEDEHQADLPFPRIKMELRNIKLSHPTITKFAALTKV